MEDHSTWPGFKADKVSRWLIDIDDNLAPFIENLCGVVRPGNFRYGENCRRSGINGDPRFQVGDVEVWVYEVSRSNGIVFDDIVIDACFGHINVVLPQDEIPAQEINVSIDNTLADHARAARRQVLRWQPNGLLTAHGTCAQSCASDFIESALNWIWFNSLR